jgi:hypothetical protein
MSWANRIRHIKNPEPEVAEAIKKYGSTAGDLPPYVLIGISKYPGILVFADNEMYANIIKKVLVKYGCEINIEKTKSHPDGETYPIEGTDASREIERIWRDR